MLKESKYKDYFPQKALLLLKNCIELKKTYLKKESIIILVCGAESKETSNSCRDTLTKYCQKHLKDYTFFYAEDVLLALYDINRKKKDLLSLEEELVKYTDCIIIILESAGSLAEIGAFAIDDNIVELLLIINDIEHKKSESFIDLGPIAKADKESKFKPTIYVDLKKILNNIDIIEGRLRSKLRQNRQNIDLTNIEIMDSKVKMLFFADLISFFSPLNTKEIVYILKYLYGDNLNFEIEMALGILKTLGEIEKNNDGYYYSTLSDRGFFLDYSFDKTKFRSEVINYYSKYYKDRTKILIERTK